jgi:hypothetical protein
MDGSRQKFRLTAGCSLKTSLLLLTTEGGSRERGVQNAKLDCQTNFCNAHKLWERNTAQTFSENFTIKINLFGENEWASVQVFTTKKGKLLTRSYSLITHMLLLLQFW